jgi:deoxycytidylate deaminase
MLLRQAAKSRHHQHYHVAIVTRGGAVLAMGHNLEGIHAEAMALGKLWPSERVGTRLQSLRLRRDGTLGMAKPCAECQALIEASGVKQVIYSDGDGNMVKTKVRR